MKKCILRHKSADPKLGPPGGPKNSPGLVFLNSSGAEFAGPKTGPLRGAGESRFCGSESRTVLESGILKLPFQGFMFHVADLNLLHLKFEGFRSGTLYNGSA